MLKFQNQATGEVVYGDKICKSCERAIARVIGGTNHVERHFENGEYIDHPWIEIHRGPEVLIGRYGDYFYTSDNETFDFMDGEEFEAAYEEVYDPEVDGYEDKYFDPEVDEHR